MKEIEYEYLEIEPSVEVEDLDTWLNKCLKHIGIDNYKILYVFTDDKNVLTLNINHLSHDYYTDILTFDLSEQNDLVESEIYISVERVAENAIDHKTTFIDELRRVMVHGILHLVGFNDHTIQEKEEMRNKENELLQLK